MLIIKLRYILYESERKNTLLYSKKQATLTIKPDSFTICNYVVDIDRSIDKSLLRLLKLYFSQDVNQTTTATVVRIDREGNKFFKQSKIKSPTTRTWLIPSEVFLERE